MAMKAAEIVRLVQEVLPDAEIKIQDTMGDNDHYALEVISEAFKGKSRIQQHQIVYNALEGRIGAELHALSLKTSTPPDL